MNIFYGFCSSVDPCMAKRYATKSAHSSATLSWKSKTNITHIVLNDVAWEEYTTTL